MEITEEMKQQIIKEYNSNRMSKLAKSKPKSVYREAAIKGWEKRKKRQNAA